MKKKFTLTIIYKHPNILLGMKKRGFGVGKWNGFGGKVNDSETVEEAARRELLEEAGIEVNYLEKVGIIDFKFTGRLEILEVHIFRSDNFLGELTESEEMQPRWWHINKIPFKNMWSDDIYWMPLFLSGKKFRGKFIFGESDLVLSHKLIEVNKL